MNYTELKQDVLDAAINYIDNYDSESENISFSDFFSDMMCDDNVTGYASGSYSMNTFTSMYIIFDLLTDYDFFVKISDTEYHEMYLKALHDGAESLEVLARMIALNDVVGYVKTFFLTRFNDTDN